MSKLIQLQVLEAKNVICGRRTEIPKREIIHWDNFWWDIGSDNAKRIFIIPTHIVIGLFDDGTTRVAGIESINALNERIDVGNLDDLYNPFFYDTIISEVTLCEAKAFVRAYYEGYGGAMEEAKKDIYDVLLESGVKITDEAKDYLLG